jgi:hypothetical protein
LVLRITVMTKRRSNLDPFFEMICSPRSGCRRRSDEETKRMVRLNGRVDNIRRNIGGPLALPVDEIDVS